MKRNFHHAIRITALSKCTMVILLMLMLVGGSAMTPGVEAQANTSQVTAAGLQSQPPSQGNPLTFMENIGQFDASIHFQASNGNTTLFLTDDALWVSLTDLPPQADPVSEAKALGAVAGADETGRKVNLKLSFVGANPQPRLEPFDELDAKVSFLTGADPSQWRADVPAWAGVRYVELYPGIDLEITGQDGQLTPRLVVREPASLQNVSLRVEGADALAVDGNHLRLTTALGDFALPLLAVEGADPEIKPAISVVDEVQQVVAPFASMSPLATAVTPTGTPTLLYSTYLGGSGQDQAQDIALDSDGNVYVIGRTYSTDLPTTPGAYDISYNGGDFDVFVSKLSADGSKLLYSTYLGGSDQDHGRGIAVDSGGNAYITGHTFSTNFPTTAGAAGTALSGQRDGFVAKLNAAGDGLVYSTYLGGDSWDYGVCIAIDDSGNAYVGGFTHGSFPVTAGAAQTVFGGMGDGFVAKLSPDGRSVLYSTYLGGYSWEGVDGIAVDHAGLAYLATSTHSTDFPTTPGAWDRVCNNCSTNYSTDGAVAKLNADGSAFIYSTLIGGADVPASDWFADIAVDSAGNAYLTGATSSTDFPTTPNALQRSFSGGEGDIVVVKLNTDGSDLLYSTYLGGSGADKGLGIAIDGNGDAYVTGFTASMDFPTVSPLQVANAGGYDAFQAVVNADASALLYSSYLGGSGDENRESSGDSYADIALDRTRQIVYLIGFTGSTDFPTTANAHDRSFNGGASDAFVTGLSVTTDTFTRITDGDIVNEGGRSTGACWGDYDNDGYVDLFVANWAGENNFLYHNSGDGTFEKITSGSIVNDGGSSRSCTWGDYDNDGFGDLAVSDDGGGIFLYHNEGGASFTRVLDTPIAQDYGNCYGISWADYDNDGWLDLFVARHTNANNLLYHNKGNGTFEKITDGAIVNDGGYSVPVSWGDYDGDGCVDLFVGNVNDQSNFLYHNNCNGSFDRITDGPIATENGFSSTSNWVDYDNDGDLDLFVGNWYEDNFLYRNDGGGTFTKITSGVIVTDGNVHDSSWADYDNDGDMDLFVGPASFHGEPGPGPQRLYQNNGDGAFTRIATGTIVKDSGASGPNWADYDHDGDLDLFVAVGEIGQHNALYRNDGVGNHWLHLKLIGAGPKQAKTATVSNKSAIGARVTVAATINGRAVQQMQEVSGQTGVFSQNSPNVEFGLGDATLINTVTIRWPSGAVQVLTNMAVDQVLTIREPRRPLKRYFLPFMVQSAPSELPIDVSPGVALQVPRAYHTATRLADGRILLVGGTQNAWDGLADVEIFDPATGQTSRAAPLHTAQYYHSATLLPDGRVLVVGGAGGGWLNDAEVYDPSTDTWTAVPPLYSHSNNHTATVMKDGRVLVVGGDIGSGVATERVEIFDPKTDTWSEAQPLSSVLSEHTAQLLDDGRVLVAGGRGTNNVPPAGGDAQIYDPQTNTWTATGPMVKPHQYSNSVRLPDGRVLVAGGVLPDPSTPPPSARAEIYDPAANTWTAAADLAEARFQHALVLLPDGQVLAVGGVRHWDCCWTETSFVREIELYDPVANAWRTVGELPQPRAAATATLLPDGRVWLTGGRNDTTYFADSWLIGPRALVPPAPLLVRYDFEGDFLASGTVTDRSGKGHDAQVTGAVASTPGIFDGQGIAFTGNGYLQAASNPAAGKTDVTFSLWFKTEHPENNYKLVSGAWWNWGPGSGWIMATHIPEFWSDDTRGLLLPGQPNNENNFPSNAWIHEVVTYDGSRIKEYTNGQLINDWAATGAALGQGNPMVVGAWPPFTGYNFQGSMDEFAIYGRSLTQPEVQALYQQGQ